MLTFSGNLRVMICLETVDMRKSFHGLAAVVRESLGGDPLDGSVFLFTNRRRNLIKLLYWDGTGLWVMAKRLEKGTYSWPQQTSGDQRSLRIEPTALAMLTDGIDLRDGVRRAWYQRD
jgi:transposase